jgi:hypothetical protein
MRQCSQQLAEAFDSLASVSRVNDGTGDTVLDDLRECSHIRHNRRYPAPLSVEHGETQVLDAAELQIHRAVGVVGANIVLRAAELDAWCRGRGGRHFIEKRALSNPLELHIQGRESGPHPTSNLQPVERPLIVN